MCQNYWKKYQLKVKQRTTWATLVFLDSKFLILFFLLKKKSRNTDIHKIFDWWVYESKYNLTELNGLAKNC